MSLLRLRSTHRAAVLVALFAGMAGCSGQNSADLTRPSALPDNLSAHGPGGPSPTVRYYAASLTPSPVTAGSTTTFTATITNCSAGTCDASHVTSQNQLIRSGAITIATGFTNVSIVNVSASGGKTWSATVVSGTIRFGATAGNQGIESNETVTITFSAKAPSQCSSPTWDTVAYQDSLGTGGVLQTGTRYERVGNDPVVAVTGCSSGCTYSQGYWKTQGGWPVSGLTLGTVSYTDAELLSILNTAPAGNGLIILAHQLIAAKLNIANGASNAAIAGSITAADALIGGLTVPPVGGGSLAPASTSALTQALTDFNEGVTGPGHCPQSN